MTAMINLNLAVITLDLGDIDRAERAVTEARSTWERRADPWGLALSTEMSGVIAISRNALEEAVTLIRQSLSLFRDLSDRGGMANCLSELALVATRTGRFTLATRLLSVAAKARNSAGTPIPSHIRDELPRSTALARSELGERRFNAAWQAGSEQTIEEVVLEVIGLDFNIREQRRTLFRIDGSRDRGVAADGQWHEGPRNWRNIFISYRTVTSHVNNILNKLGVDSRTAASTEAVRLGLI